MSVRDYSQTMAKFPPPKEFSFTPGDWAAWRERFERCARATKLSNEEESVRIDCLVYSMGEKADSIFKTFTYGPGESADKYDVVIKKFEQYFVPKRNVIYERSMFHARKKSIPLKIGPLGPYIGPNDPRGGIFALGNMCFHKPGSDRDLWEPLKFCHQGGAWGPLLPTRLKTITYQTIVYIAYR